MLYIQEKRGKYLLQKGNTYIGSFTSLELAREVRDDLIAHDWDIVLVEEYRSKYKFKPKTGYIRNRNNGYTIIKYINNKSIGIVTVHSMCVAIIVRDYLIKHDWSYKAINYIRKRFSKQYKHDYKYITNNGSSYVIQKYINGTMEYFGSFNSLADALRERNLLMKYNWDLDSFIDIE